MYRIKQVRQLTGISPETIRYYERIKMLPAPRRTPNGYRLYTADDVNRLRFIHRSRQLDLSLDNITEILSLRDGGKQPCEIVQSLIRAKIAEIQRRIDDLEQLRDELIALDKIGQTLPPAPLATCVCQIIETNLRE